MVDHLSILSDISFDDAASPTRRGKSKVSDTPSKAKSSAWLEDNGDEEVLVVQSFDDEGPVLSLEDSENSVAKLNRASIASHDSHPPKSTGWSSPISSSRTSLSIKSPSSSIKTAERVSVGPTSPSSVKSASSLAAAKTSRGSPASVKSTDQSSLSVARTEHSSLISVKSAGLLTPRTPSGREASPASIKSAERPTPKARSRMTSPASIKSAGRLSPDSAKSVSGTTELSVSSVREMIPPSARPPRPKTRSQIPVKAAQLSSTLNKPSENLGVKEPSTSESQMQAIQDPDVSTIKDSSKPNVNIEKANKDDIRRRIKAAKERAGVTAHLKGKQRKKSLVLYSEPVSTKEDKEVEEAMKKHKEARNKWKHLTRITKQISSLEEEYDFFLRGSRDESDITESKSPQDSTTSITEEMRLMQSAGEWGPDVFYSPAVPIDKEMLKLKQRGIFFCPSSSPVPIEEKLEPNATPRFIEDEGLYVSRKHAVSWRSKNKMEQRIMASGSEKIWFGEDGEIKCLGEPLDYVHATVLHDPFEMDSLVEYKPASIPGKDEDYLVDDVSYILEVDVGEIRLHKHPLFLKEHKLAHSLRTLTDNLHRRERDLIVPKLYGRLEALRNSKAHSERLYAIDHDEIHKYRIQVYKREMKSAREAWLEEGKENRRLLTGILEAWRDLKRLRKHQGGSFTSLKLEIAEAPEKEDDMWSKELANLTRELEEEEMEEYREKKREYKKRLEEARRKHRDMTDSDDSEPGQSADEEVKQNLGREPKRPPPGLAVEKARRLLGESLRGPGEPPLLFAMAHMDPTLPAPQQFLNDYEKEFGKGFWISLKYNGREVGKARGMDSEFKEKPSFNFSVEHRFSVQLSSRPKSVALIVFSPRRGARSSHQLAQINLPLPPRIRTEEATWEDISWASEAALGVEGSISVRSGWALHIPHAIYSLDIEAQPTKSQLVNQPEDSERLKAWIELSQMDNSKSKETANEGGQKALAKELEFCSEKDLDEDPRLKLLSLRHKGEPEFRAMRCIPLRNKQIPPDIFKGYEKRLSGRSGVIGEGRLKGGPFDIVRSRGIKAFEETRAAAAASHRTHRLRTRADIIADHPIVDFSSLLSSLITWLQPKRPLRPVRRERKKVPIKSLVGQQLQIAVTVLRAMHVPVRTDVDHYTPDAMDGMSLLPVRPFLEVTFQGARMRTYTAQGPNPVWNQELRLPIRVSDSTEAGLQGLKDSLHCHLYDEPIVDLIEDERERERNIHHRLDRHWLASLTIPFSALYANNRIEGTFQMYSPPMMIGYERESKDLRNKTFLSLLVTIIPPIHPPQNIRERVESGEEASVEEHLVEWERRVRRELPHCCYLVSLVMGPGGRSVCPTRFIAPIPPPIVVEGNETTPHLAARFVAMIPTITGLTTSLGLFDLWLTADQVVKGVCGARVDKAVLLACYLTHLGSHSWVCLGDGLPHGPSAWVLSAKTEKGTYIVWDPDSGLSYPYNDPFCPLRQPHCLIDATNIWVSEEREEGQRRIDLGEWRTAFGRHIPAPSQIVQPSNLTYQLPNTVDASLLQDKLEQLLRSAVMKLRSTCRTVWNRYCSNALRKVLVLLEKAAWDPESPSPDFSTDLNHIMTSHKMCGFPINLPYTTGAALVEAVKATGVHLNDSPDTELALAVYVHPFPSNVLSVWIYIASLTRRR